jgi:hypothetical protein
MRRSPLRDVMRQAEDDETGDAGQAEKPVRRMLATIEVSYEGFFSNRVCPDIMRCRYGG